MPEATTGQSNRWLSVITVDAKEFGADREAIRVELEKHNIESRPMWKPMHLQPVFKGAEMVGGKVSEALFKDGLCLPSSTQMSDATLQKIVDIIKGLAK